MKNVIWTNIAIMFLASYTVTLLLLLAGVTSPTLNIGALCATGMIFGLFDFRLTKDKDK